MTDTARRAAAAAAATRDPRPLAIRALAGHDPPLPLAALPLFFTERQRPPGMTPLARSPRRAA